MLKPLVFVTAAAPFVALVYGLLQGQLGPNPIDQLTDDTGTLAIRFLLIALTVTPLRWALKKGWPLKLRRMLGLFAFFYASLHVLVYFVLDQQLSITLIIEDLTERPYIVAGSIAFLILLPLALSSTRRMVRRLGRQWAVLHRWVYIAATAAVVHYVWLAKGDLIEPYVYLSWLFVLLTYRLTREVSQNKASAPA